MNPTLEEVCLIYIESKIADDRHSKAISDIKLSLNKLESLYNVRINEIQTSRIIDITLKIKGEGLSSATTNKYSKYIRSLCKYMDDVYDVKNHGKQIKLVESPNKSCLFNIWTPEVFAKFSKCLPSYEMTLFFETLFLTGMGVGEYKALTPSDLLETNEIRIHDLRHSHASLLIEANPNNITYVSKRLGHSSTKITWEVYQHLVKDEKDILSGDLNSIYTSI